MGQATGGNDQKLAVLRLKGQVRPAGAAKHLADLGIWHIEGSQHVGIADVASLM